LAPSSRLAAAYMQIHVALVGLRALVGNPLGGWLSDATGDPRYVFALSCVLFIAATVVMRALAREIDREGPPAEEVPPATSTEPPRPISGVGSATTE
ncbi:MAG: hypothetical protein KDC38_08440, partial [Planctomycetes bacterium]|nr:hypothetical protein [Planctomycetota bacterium]